MHASEMARIEEILADHELMTIATNRPDGYPQATSVNFVNEGTTIYFGCSPDCQKAENLRRDDRASVTIDHATRKWDEIVGLSMAVRATEVTDPQEREKVGRMMFERFPQINEYVPEEMREMEPAVFRLTPVVVSILDYRKGFGHTESVACEAG